MKYINLLYSKDKVGILTDHDHHNYESTTVFNVTENDINSLEKENLVNLCYKLRDNETTKKWVKLFLEAESISRKQGIAKEWHYNYYSTPTWQVVQVGRVKLNETIEAVKKLNLFDIPDSLKLDTEDYKIIELDKLNELHFIFESVSHEQLKNHPNRDTLFNFLETINNLVHVCERYIPTLDNAVEQQFHSYRLIADIENLPMEDSDFVNMEIDIKNTAMVDFATVGKDLGTCFYTDDKELVRKKEIKQQEFIKPFLSFEWGGFPKDSTDEYKLYYEWAEEAETSKYGYNVKEPKYNLGRVVVGDLLNKESINTSDISKVLYKFPNFVDILLTDEPIGKKEGCIFDPEAMLAEFEKMTLEFHNDTKEYEQAKRDYKLALAEAEEKMDQAFIDYNNKKERYFESELSDWFLTGVNSKK